MTAAPFALHDGAMGSGRKGRTDRKDADAKHAPRAELVPDEPLTIEARIEEIHRRVVLRGGSELTGMLDLLGNRRRVMWVNFLAGLARGVGFFLGVSLLGGVLLGLFALFFDKATETLGFKDLTVKQAVRAAYMKFDEIQHDLEEVRAELAAARKGAADTDAPPQAGTEPPGTGAGTAPPDAGPTGPGGGR